MFIKEIKLYQYHEVVPKFKTNHNVLFRRWLWQPDSNIKQEKQKVEGL